MPKAGSLVGVPLIGCRDFADRNGEFATGRQFKGGDGNAFDENGVLMRLHRQVVGEFQRRQHVAEIGCQLAADAGHAPQQGRVRAAFDQLDQSQADFDSERLHLQQILQVVLSVRLSICCRRKLGGASTFRRFFCFQA